MPRRLSVLLLIAACGCSSQSAPPAPSLAPCERYVENVMRLRGTELVDGALPDQQARWAARVSFAMLDACVYDRWPDAAVRCGATATDEGALSSCVQPPADSRGRLDASLRSLAEQMNARAEAPSSETGIPECDQYTIVFQSYVACDNVPEPARTASREALAITIEGWKQFRDPNFPAEAKRAAADACRQSTEALRQSASALGCRL